MIKTLNIIHDIYIFIALGPCLSTPACAHHPKAAIAGWCWNRGGLSLHDCGYLSRPKNLKLSSGKSSACCCPVIASHLSSFCSFEVGIIAWIESNNRPLQLFRLRLKPFNLQLVCKTQMCLGDHLAHQRWISLGFGSAPGTSTLIFSSQPFWRFPVGLVVTEQPLRKMFEPPHQHGCRFRERLPKRSLNKINPKDLWEKQKLLHERRVPDRPTTIFIVRSFRMFHRNWSPIAIDKE